MKTLKYYAIRIGDHVEIRVAGQRPAALISSYTRPSTKKVVKYEYFPDPPYSKKTVTTETTKMVLKQTYYVGGRVLGVLKYCSFHALTGLNLKLYSIIEITKEQKEGCMQYRGRLKWDLTIGEMANILIGYVVNAD